MERVAAARLALAEAEKHQEEPAALSTFIRLSAWPLVLSPQIQCHLPINQLLVPAGIRCVLPLAPDSMEDPLGFSCLYPSPIVDSHSGNFKESGNFKYHFMAYGAYKCHVARISPA